MTIPAVLAVLGVAALLLIVYLAKGLHGTSGDLEHLASQLRPIDVHAFRNLIDEHEVNFLRERLLPRDFRRIQRERSLAAAEYVWCAAQNAAILIRMAEAARQDADAATSAAAEQLLRNALRLRLYSLHAVPRLYVGIFWPWAAAKPGFVADTYDSMSRQMVRLGRPQYSARGMSSPA